MCRRPIGIRHAGVLILLVITGMAGCVGVDDPVETTPPGSEATMPVVPAGVPSPSGDYRKEGPGSYPLDPGPFAVEPPVVERIASDLDGATIGIKVYRPATADPVPVIMLPSPYYHDFEQGDEKRECNGFGPVLGPTSETGGACRVVLASVIDSFVPHGFGVALVSARGTGSSGGCHEFLSAREIDDAMQAARWLADAPWSDGQIAVYGMSAGGYAAFAMAARGDPVIKAIIAMSAGPSLRELYITNGTHWPSELHSAIFLGAYELGAVHPRDDSELGGAACPGQAEEMRVALELWADPYGNRAWWDERDWREDILMNYNGSVLTSAGRLEAPGAVHDIGSFGAAMRKAGIDVHQFYGSWGHVTPDIARSDANPIDQNLALRWDWNELLLRWLQSKLHGDPAALWPRMQIEDQAGQWRTEDVWPPTDAEPTEFPLDEMEMKGGLAAPGTNVSLAGPAFLGPDGLSFEAVMDQELRFSGMGRVEAHVSATGPGGLVAIDVVHKETEAIVMRGLLDLAYRDGTTTAQPVQAGVRYVVEVLLREGDGVIPAGETLAVRFQVGTSWKDPEPPLEYFPVQVHGAGHVVLPVIERDGSTFFEVP